MKALGLALIAFCTLSIGALIWATYFDDSLREPRAPLGVGAEKAASEEPHALSAISSSGGGSTTSLQAAAKRDSVQAHIAGIPPVASAPPAAMVYDTFSENPYKPRPPLSDPAETARVREVRTQMLRAEFFADAGAFAAKYGLSPEQIKEIEAGKVSLDQIQEIRGASPSVPQK
jgi:hypothetical protein